MKSNILIDIQKMGGTKKMANKNQQTIVEAFIEIADTAKNIYKNENLTNIRIYISGNIVYVDALTVNREHYDEWESIYCDNKEEIEIARKLIDRIRFPKERIEYDKDGIYITIRNSPKLNRIREAIYELQNASWIKEFHEEDEGYSLITKKEKSLRKFYNKYKDIVSIYLEDGIYKVYF